MAASSPHDSMRQDGPATEVTELLGRVRCVLLAQYARLRADPPLAARVRRDPVALARLLAEVPPDLLGIDREAWSEVARHLPKITPSSRSVGLVLRDTGLSESRLARLLRGGFAVREGLRWLVAKDAAHANVAQLLGLDLLRATGRIGNLAELADVIALDYARAARRGYPRSQNTSQ